MAQDQEKKKRTPTPKKRELQHEKKRLRNKQLKSEIRTSVRKLEDAIKSGEGIQEKLNGVYSLMDKAAQKGIYSRNKTARTKARLTAKAAKSA